MNSRLVFLFLLTLSVPATCRGQDHPLEFVKQMGAGWKADKYGWMSFVSFNQDGTMVASDGATTPDDVSGYLSIWSFPEGKLIKQFGFRPEALSGDWKYYATYHGVGELASGRELTSLGENYGVHAFSPDSRFVAESPAVQSDHGPTIRVLDLASGKQVSGFGKHVARALAIGPDGKTLASGNWDIVTLWNLTTGERLGALRGFGRYVESLSFSKDGSLLAGGTDLGSVQIWDVGRHARLHALTIEGGQVSQPAWSPDGRFVGVGIYGTGTAYLIDVASGKIVDRQKVSDLGCGSLAFSPDGRFLITPSTGGLIKWPYDRGGTIRVFKVSAR